jgi:hypothetical protein
VSVIDENTGDSESSVTLCAVTRGLAYDRIQRLVYASVGHCKEVAIFQPKDAIPLGEIAVPGEPGLLTIDRDNRLLFVTLPDEDKVAIVNLTGNRVGIVVDTGDQPYMVTVVP